ncbi:MAG: rod-binding protein [Paracoccaceae bacterium]
MDIVAPSPPTDRHGAAALHRRAEEMEAAFLAEMLRHAGMSPATGAFSGGVGEEQFASFLRDAQADAMARGGGIGLAEMLIRSLAEEAR